MTRLLATTALCMGLSLGLAAAQQQPRQQDLMPSGSQTPGPEASPPAAQPGGPPPDAGAAGGQPGATATPNSRNPPSANPSEAVSGRVVDTTPGADAARPADPAAASADRFLQQQTANEMSAEDLIGSSVYDADEASIGTVSDIILDNQGRILAAVIGVGGFLGIGEKDVAIRFGELNHRVEEDGDIRIMLQASREQLQSAPDYAYLREQRGAGQPATGAVSPEQRPSSTGTGTNTGAGKGATPNTAPR